MGGLWAALGRRARPGGTEGGAQGCFQATAGRDPVRPASPGAAALQGRHSSQGTAQGGTPILCRLNGSRALRLRLRLRLRLCRGCGGGATGGRAGGGGLPYKMLGEWQSKCN